jgi:ligand-binding SRPBCC domain-containing protein
MNRITFVATTPIAASAEVVFAWHEAPGALQQLTPPWERIRVLSQEGGIRDGSRVSLLIGPAPFSLRWDLEHRDFQHGRSFTDIQRKGPFRYWTHAHRMLPQGPHACFLEDTIEFELPMGFLGRLLGGPPVRRRLMRLFAFRHDVTRRACENL